MTVAVSSDLYSKSVEVINDSLYDLGISVDDKKTKGSYIYLECEEDRSDTRSSLEMELENINITKLRKENFYQASLNLLDEPLKFKYFDGIAKNIYWNKKIPGTNNFISLSK